MGLLDALQADELLSYIERKGNEEKIFDVDCGEIREYLAEGVMQLEAGLLKSHGESNFKRLRLFGIDEKGARMFSLFGFVVDGGEILLTPYTQHNASKESHASATVCPRCLTALDLESQGLYRCPKCDARISYDGKGRITAHETF